MDTARDIMTPNPDTCKINDTVYEAVRLMKEDDIGIVPIVDEDNRVIGVVTDRDICLDIILNQLDPQSTRLEQVMHSGLVTCQPDEDIEAVLDKMEEKQVRRILVVDDADRCVGIISEKDIAEAVGERVAELVEAVTQG